MGLTKDYLRYAYAGRCNIVGSQNGVIQSVDKVSCAVSTAEAVTIFNMRTLEKVNEISRDAVEVTVFRYSDDRKQLAIGYSDGEVHLYRSEGKKGEFGEPIIFTGHRTGVNALAFSNDGLTLASGGKDSIVVLWDIVSESGIYRFIGHKSTITQVQFTLDDKYLVSSSKDTQVKFWDIASQSCIYTLIDCASEVYCFSLIKSDRLLIVGTANLESQVYEIVWLDNSADRSDELQEPPSKMNHLVGAETFEREHDQGNEVFRCIKRGILLRQAKGRTLQMNVSADESLLCLLGSDSVIDVFRIFSDEESRKRFKKKLHKAKKSATDESGDMQITQNEIAKDISLMIMRAGIVQLPAKIKWIDLYREVKVKDTTMSYRVCCLLKSNTIHGVMIDLDTKANQITAESIVDLDYRGHRFDIRTLAVTSNNAAFLSGSADSAILWDMQTLMPINRFTDESLKDITTSLFVAGDKQFLVGTKTGSLFLFDIPSCELIETNKDAHAGAISSMVTLPNGKGFVTCGADKSAVFWKYHLQNEIDRKRLSFRKEKTVTLQDEILCTVISPNGKFIAFGLLDNTVRVYYLESMKFFLTLYGHSLPVTCVDIGPDNKLVATGSMDKTVKIWGLDFGDCHRSLFAHDDAVSCVKFNKDVEEQLIWSAGRDGKIKQWNAQKFDLIQTLNGHFAEIRALTQTTDANTLISASRDKTIRLWELTDEIIVVADEQEKEREKEDFTRIVDAEDIVPGENPENALGMAAKKNISSVKGAEAILEALEIYREELAEQAEDPKHKPHPLITAYKSANLNHFVLDAINKVNASHLERSLLLVPFDYVADILNCLSKCVEQHYKLELAIRISVFLFKTNLNQLTGQKEFLPKMKTLQEILPTTVKTTKDQINFNLAALRLHKLSIEERDEIQLFRKIAGDSTAKKKKSKKVRDIAIVNPVHI
ncbi:Utp12 domain-containing protein [Aphelenchoides bicaudatus]|nr:Utp12 domain-containing protein [Aphelenchoides bicaudatus]